MSTWKRHNSSIKSDPSCSYGSWSLFNTFQRLHDPSPGSCSPLLPSNSSAPTEVLYLVRDDIVGEARTVTPDDPRLRHGSYGEALTCDCSTTGRGRFRIARVAGLVLIVSRLGGGAATMRRRCSVRTDHEGHSKAKE